MDRDDRSFCVALVADELVNNGAAGFDVLGVLDRAGWGLIVLPPAWYENAVAAPLLDQVAEHVHEFAHNGYALALVGERAGLADALAAAGMALPESIVPHDAAQLEAALSARASDLAPRDAAGSRRAAP